MSTTNSAGWDAGTAMHPAIGDEPERESIDCGEAAFPTANGQFWGMSLRDYFAAKAMQGLIVDPARADQSREECARLAYAMADAMIRARATK